MKDPRIQRLAEMMVQYSTDVQPKQKVLLRGSAVAQPLLLAIYQEVLQAGAYPFLMPFIRQGDHMLLGVETLAFAGVVFGLAISPIHLCLALSASYFNAPLVRIILRVLPAALCVAVAGVAMALLSH